MPTEAPLKFKIPTGIKPSKGKVLLSEPFMADNNFNRSAILLCEHIESEGSFGLVLNKELTIRLSDAIPEFADFDVPLYFGGPVQPDTLNYLHRIPELLPSSVEILEGVYMGGDFDVLRTLIMDGNINAADIRFFVGYTGWEAGQIQDEIKEDSWIITNMTTKLIFDREPTSLWKKILENMGGDYHVMANFPENVLLN